MSGNPVILSVDFDFFIREIPILDWGHSETTEPEVQSMIWAARLFGSRVDLLDVLRPPRGPAPSEFWEALEARGFRLEDSLAFFADSHAVGGNEVFRCLDKTVKYDVVHLDAHHDLGYKRTIGEYKECRNKPPSCEDWLLVYSAVSRCVDSVQVVYPEWRREPCPLTGMPVDERDHYLPAQILEQVGVDLQIGYWDDLKEEEREVEFLCVARSPAWVPPWLDGEFEVLMEACPSYEHHHAFGLKGGDRFSSRQETQQV